jgi:hypothetical protein
MKFGRGGTTANLVLAITPSVFETDADMKFGGAGNTAVLPSSITAEAATKLGGGGNRELSADTTADASESLVLLAAAKMELSRDGNISSGEEDASFTLDAAMKFGGGGKLDGGEESDSPRTLDAPMKFGKGSSWT